MTNQMRSLYLKNMPKLKKSKNKIVNEFGTLIELDARIVGKYLIRVIMESPESTMCNTITRKEAKALRDILDNMLN